MKIYPKTNEYLEGIEEFEKTLKEYKGIEIQYFKKSDKELVDFKIEKPIEQILERYPYIEEITIHPPLCEYELEIVLLKDKNIFLNQIKTIVRLSKKYNIKINIVEHTRLLMSQAKLTILPVLEKAKKIMKNTNTKIVFENIYMMEEQENCSVIELCEYLNSENMKVCIDMCHLYCQAHIYKKKIEEFLEKYLNKEKCQRQVYQIHFAYTANEDGYIDRTTHAIMHPNEETLYYDAKLLCQYGMGDCNWITEVSEKDYSTRKDQVNEIKMLSNQKIKLEE
ncbi:MAG: TIM barrel protein [Clostridia bacterium]|mgnify:FL=1